MFSQGFKILPKSVADPFYQLKWLRLIGGIAYVLSELCEGHEPTHKALYAGGILKEISFYLSITHQKNYIAVAVCQRKCLGVVGAILELNTYQNSQFANDLSKGLDLVQIRLAMNTFYFIAFFCEHWGSSNPDAAFPKTQVPLLLNNGFRCYWILRRIKDLTGLDIVATSSPEHWDEIIEKKSAVEQEEHDNNVGSHEEFEAMSKEIYALDKVLRKDAALVEAMATVGDELDKFKIFHEKVLFRFSIANQKHVRTTDDRILYFANYTKSIEFLRDGSLEKLYFQILDVELMSQSYRTRVLANLNWNTAQDKVRGLLHSFKSMENTIAAQKTLKTMWGSRFVAEETSFTWQVLVMIVTYVLNIMMLAAFSNNRDASIATEITDTYMLLPEWYNQGLWIVGIVHIVLSCGVCLQYFVNQYTGEGVAALLSSDVSGSIYYVAFLACSILGLFFHGYFYMFHLLYVILPNPPLPWYSTPPADETSHQCPLEPVARYLCRFVLTCATLLMPSSHSVRYIVQNNKDLGSAVNAITYNGRSLLWVSALTLTIVYIFSVFAFLFFRKDFNNDDGLYCNSLLDCLATLLTNGVEAGGIRDRLGAGAQLGNLTTFNTSQVRCY